MKRFTSILASEAVGLIFILALFAYFTAGTMQYLRLSDNALSTTGRVVEGAARSYRTLRVEYEDKRGETVQALIGDFGTEPSVGEAVAVEYDPENPSSARLAGNPSPLIFHSFGNLSATALLAIIVWSHVRPRQRDG